MVQGTKEKVKRNGSSSTLLRWHGKAGHLCVAKLRSVQVRMQPQSGAEVSGADLSLNLDFKKCQINCKLLLILGAMIVFYAVLTKKLHFSNI